MAKSMYFKNIRFNILKGFISFVAFVFILICHPSPMRAGWENMGLYGGQVYDIAIDPENPDKMFAGTYYGDGLFMTTDGGNNWVPVLTGKEDTSLDGQATFRNTAVLTVEIARSNHNVVWVAHDYYVEKSTNGGSNWTHVFGTGQNTETRFCRSLTVDPAHPAIAYIGMGGPWNDYYPYGTIYKTTDGGTSWTAIGPYDYTEDDITFYNQFPSKVVEIAIDRSSGRNRIWALTTNELYLSYDGGNSWTLLLTGLNCYEQSGLVIYPDDPDLVFIADYYGIFYFDHYNYTYYFDDDSYYGYLWGEWGGSIEEVRALTYDPQYPNFLYVSWGDANVTCLGWDWDLNTDDSRYLYVWGEDEYYPGKFLALAVHPQNSNVIFGGEFQRGVYKGVWQSDTYDFLWSTINTGLSAIQVWDIVTDPNDSSHLLAATGSGVYEKQGTGDWTQIAWAQGVSVESVAFDPVFEGTYYAGTDGNCYTTFDGGGHWYVDESNPAINGTVNSITVIPDSNAMYLTTYNNGNVYKSTDWGYTFTSIKPAGEFSYNTVAVDPTNYDHIFLGGGNYFAPVLWGKLYESDNGGNNWSIALDNVVINVLKYDPNDSDIIYAGCGKSGGSGTPLYKSTDGGVTWKKSYEGIPGSPSRYGIWGSSANDIFVLRHTGSVLRDSVNDKWISHYGPTEWSLQNIAVSTPLYDIWGTSSSNVYAVGDTGTIRHYNGLSWGAVSSGTTEDLLGLWGSTQNNIFVTGRHGTILHYAGSSWSVMNSNTPNDLETIWGGSGSVVFAAGSYGTILKYDGSKWNKMTSNTSVKLEGLWGGSESSVYAVGSATVDGANRYYTVLHYNGSNWRRMTNIPHVPGGKSGDLHSIWGSGPSDIWAVGDDGIILHYNGSGWAVEASGTTDNLYDVWGTSSSNVYATGQYGTAVKRDDTSWSLITIPDAENSYALWNALTDLAFSDDGKIFASTNRQNIYASANQGRDWISMGGPPYIIYSVTAGSVEVAGNAGAFTLDGEGILYGYVKDEAEAPISDALVKTDFGKELTTNYLGEWTIHHPAGMFDVTASHPDYTSFTYKNVEVYDGTFSYVGFNLNNLNVDSDGDGMPDYWEIQYGLKPLVNDAGDDADGDGFSNLTEYQRGTIPNNEQSHPPRPMPWLPILLED